MMTNEQLNTALYKKMFAEQEEFKNWLLTLPPEKILEHSYEYTVREDFLVALECDSLTSGQATALLASSNPLDDLFHRYEEIGANHMEEIWECFENWAEQLRAKQAMREKRINLSCKEAIEKAISNNYKENSLDVKKAVQEVLSQFEVDRVQLILAVTVENKDWDVRVSHENKTWAQAVLMSVDDENDYSDLELDKHSGLINLFVDQFRFVNQLEETRG